MSAAVHRWRFFRAGGFDQVRLDSAADLLAIGSLDQKLWVALSCPVKGIEFDARTLELIDSDADGHLRAPELIAAVRWAGERLADAESLVRRADGISIADLRTDDDAGMAIAAAARVLLAELGRDESGVITVEEASGAQARLTARALESWRVQATSAQPLGEATEAAHAAVLGVADKIEDFFVRCRLAAFDARAGDALNAADDALASLAPGLLTSEASGVAALPLARVAAGAALPLGEGVNPAWAERTATLRSAAVRPLLGDRDALAEADWRALQQALAPYAQWLAARPDAPGTVTGIEAGIGDLERLVRYVRDLMPLANNFVAFRDFYARQAPATFQVGTLYLDGRSCELCVAVTDAAKHAALATLSRIFLAYCECTRGSEKLTIAAAFTAGDADQLMPGRNGVFYDRQGRDWDATITRIVEHPISLRQAFWSPYRKLVRLIAEQAQKLAANRARSVEDQMAAATTDASKKVALPGARPAAAPAPFDAGRFAGIFAAVGLAVGAIGTAVAAMVTGILALKWWQMPLALAGLMLVVSGPAVILAWLKLGSRNLGPILDANGWAINARARINIPFGTSLTHTAQLPPNAERALTDPYAEKKAPWRLYLTIAAVLVAVAVWWLMRAPAR